VSAPSVVLALVVLAACDGDDPAPQGLRVSPYLQVGDCLVPLAGGETIDATVAVALGLDSGRLCFGAMTPGSRVSPGDSVLLVIDYGAEIIVSDGISPTPPVLSPMINAVATPLTLGAATPHNLGGRAVIEMPFVVPLQPPETLLQIGVQAVPDLARAQPLLFTIGDLVAQISIDQCTSTPCTVAAGSQSVNVRVSTAGRTPQMATLHVLVDDIEQAMVPVALTTSIQGGRIGGSTPLPVPLFAANTRWSFRAEIGSSTTPLVTVTIGDLPITVTVDRCDETPACQVVGGGDPVSVHVRVQGIRAQVVNLRQIINDAPQATVKTVTVGQIVGDAVEIAEFVDVPLLPEGTRWDLRAELGPFSRQLPHTLTIVPPKAVLAVAECGGTSCRLPSGIGTVTVTAIVDGMRPQHVVLRSRIDGVLQPAALGAIDANTNLGDHMKGTTTAPIAVPATRDGASWEIVGELGSENGVVPIMLTAPIVRVEVDACCNLVNGVGTAAIHVTMEGHDVQHLQLSSIVDGVAQPGTTPVEVKDVIGDEITGMAFVPVPTIGADWRLTVSLGGVVRSSPALALAPPMIRRALSCGEACQPAAGTTASLVVTAPLLLRDLTTIANVRREDGTVVLSNAPVQLTARDNVAQTISGSLPIPVPNVPAQRLFIDVMAGGFSATTYIITIAP